LQKQTFGQTVLAFLKQDRFSEDGGSDGRHTHSHSHTLTHTHTGQRWATAQTIGATITLLMADWAPKGHLTHLTYTLFPLFSLSPTNY